MNPIFTYYATLDCHRGMTNDELRTMYRTAARRHHPDKGGDPAKFSEVTSAYMEVKDGPSRDSLLIRLKGLGDPCSACGQKGYRQAKRGFQPIGPKTACTTCGGCGFVPR